MEILLREYFKFIENNFLIKFDFDEKEFKEFKE